MLDACVYALHREESVFLKQLFIWKVVIYYEILQIAEDIFWHCWCLYITHNPSPKIKRKKKINTFSSQSQRILYINSHWLRLSVQGEIVLLLVSCTMQCNNDRTVSSNNLNFCWYHNFTFENKLIQTWLPSFYASCCIELVPLLNLQFRALLSSRRRNAHDFLTFSTIHFDIETGTKRLVHPFFILFNLSSATLSSCRHDHFKHFIDHIKVFQSKTE